MGEVYLNKIDVVRAFRNLRLDHVDALKLGIKWENGFYIDGSVVFSCVHGSSAFQMTSDAISHITRYKNHKIFAYIDYIIVGSKLTTNQAFKDLSDLLTELGLPMNPDKKTPPTRDLTYFGIPINIADNTLSIDIGKLQQIYRECVHFSTKTSLGKKVMQSLLGKLLYLHKCVLPARAFINRTLDLLQLPC